MATASIPLSNLAFAHHPLPPLSFSLAPSHPPQIPTLETPEGSLFESNACARYIARLRPDKNLYGETFFESGQVDSWIDFCSHEVELPATMWVYPIMGYLPPHDVASSKAQDDMKRALTVLNNHLASRTFMVGKNVTLADLALFSALYYPMKLVLDSKFRKPYAHVERWFETIANQPEVLAVIGETQVCKKALQAPGAAAGGAGGKAKGGKQEKKKKGGKKGGDAKPKQEQKAAEKKPETIKDRMNKLPKSSLTIDEWKRTFSGVDRTEASQRTAFEWFTENMDWDGYSLFIQEYKYNDENKMSFMTCNGVKGFQQRTEEMRKYAFGMMHVVGAEGPFKVRGAWLVRGDTMADFIQANDECEYYTWTKVEKGDAAALAAVNDCWSAGWSEGSTLDGVEIYDSFEFK